MARLHLYRAIFKTKDDRYYSKSIPKSCMHHQEAEREARKLKIKDEFVAIESDEEEFI